MKINRHAICGQCRLGQNYGVPAISYATGKNEYKKPWHGYLCGNHLQTMQEDGAILRIRFLKPELNHAHHETTDT